MNVFESLLTTGRIVDFMIAFLVLEILLVSVLRRTNGSGIPAIPLLVNIGAGASLMLALRAALTQEGPGWLVVFLVSALVFHVADLAIRWQPAGSD